MFVKVDVYDLFVLALGVGVQEDIFLGVEHYLALVVEVDLNELVVQSEHYRLLGFHPLLNIDKGNVLGLHGSCLSSTALQIFPEILHQR